MPDFDREMKKLAEEVGEARKQSSKTETQLGELLGTFKAFEARFGGLERRARASHFGTHLVAAIVVAGATYSVASVQVRHNQRQLNEMLATTTAQKERTARREAELTAKLAELKRQKDERAAASAAAKKLLEHLDAGQHEQVEKALPSLKMASLDPLARDLVDKRVAAFRAEVAEAAYKWGRELLSRRRRRDGIAELRRAVDIWPDGPQAASARYWLANTLRDSKRFDEAAEIFSNIRQLDDDESIQEEAGYWEAYCRVRTGDFENARKLFTSVASAGGSHAGPARAQLQALEEQQPSSGDTRPQ